jgi:hypothetical protein
MQSVNFLGRREREREEHLLPLFGISPQSDLSLDHFGDNKFAVALFRI